MDNLPEALLSLHSVNQFIVYKLVRSETRIGKNDKLPINYQNGEIANALEPSNWTSVDQAITMAKKFGKEYGVGFVFTKNDPYWFLDIDDCLLPDNTWSPIANELCTLFHGAAVELSSSGKGLHIFGRSVPMKHSCKNSQHNLELYTSGRFVALTGNGIIGNIDTDHTDKLKNVIEKYFTPTATHNDDKTWTNTPVPEWNGIINDDELIERALLSTSANHLFGIGASFSDLWNANSHVLTNAYPDTSGVREYDASSADSALAQHLAFWTGNNCKRMLQLMQRSALKRDKWEREDYLTRTILNACQRQKTWYSTQKNQTNDQTTPPLSPEPLPNLPDVLPFDYEYLPETIHEYVKDISERMQCPPDFPAIAVIVMLASLIGRKVGIRPKQKDDWVIIPNIWGAVVGNSGIKKTPAISAALKPIQQLQANAHENFKFLQAQYNDVIEIEKLKSNIKKAKARETLKKDQSTDVTDILKSDIHNERPILKRYITNNATYEKLGEILAENPNGVLVEYDEIIGLLKQLQTSGQEVARSFYLSGANGDTPCTFDRIGRGTLHIPSVCLSIIGGIQPGVLASYVRQAVDGRDGADGLLQRFGLMVYPDISIECSYVDRLPNQRAREAMHNLVNNIDTMNTMDTTSQIDSKSGIPFLRFDDDAQMLYSEWSVELDQRLRSGEEHPAIVSHLAKYHKLVPSLALINHLSGDHRSQFIRKSDLQRAINFSVYLESHAKRIYSYATRPDVDAAKTMLKRLLNGKITTPFKARDVSQKGWAGLETSAKTQAAIELLVDYQHLSEEIISTGGRPTSCYHWHRREK